MPPSNLKELLDNIRTVAVIGCSSNPYRTSYHIAEYLQNAGIRIIPVNPNETEVLGEKAYDSMSDLPDDIHIDVVDIFRNKKFTADMVEQVVEWSKNTGQKPAVWTQLDVSTPAAEQLAGKHDLSYVKNRCLMVEHRNR